jgi:hypothetical protein
LQDYINQFPHCLDTEIERLLPVTARPAGQHIQWLSPPESDGYRAFGNADFHRVAGLSDPQEEPACCWSRLGTCWDALGVIAHGKGQPKGVLLVEAKSHLDEMDGQGCQAPDRSRPLILETFSETRQWLNALETPDWTGPLYRTANRMAHLHLLRNHMGVPAWLIQVYFLNDPAGPVSRADWLPAIAGAQARLGLRRRPPFTLDVFLPALNPV